MATAPTGTAGPGGDPASPESLAELAWRHRSGDPAVAEAAVATLRVTGEPALARALAALANAQWRAGRADQAAVCLSEAEALARTAGDDLATARICNVRGAIALGSASYADAVRLFRLSAEAFDAASDEAGAAGTLVNLSVVHRNLGDHATALELLLDAAGRFRDIRDEYGEAVALSNLVAVYRDLGDFRAAVPLASRADELARRSGHEGFAAHTRAGFGAVLAGAGQVERGRQELLAAADQARRSGVPMAISEALGSLAAIEAAASPARARELLEEALPAARAAGDSWSVLSGLLVLADCTPDPADSRRLFAEAVALAQGQGERLLLGRAHRGAARAAEAAGDLRAALLHWRCAAEAADADNATRSAQRLALLEVSAALNEARAEAGRQREQAAEMTALGRHRGDLLATVSHDLRGPLQIAGLSLDIAREQADPRMLDHLDRVSTSLRRVTTVLDAVRDDSAAAQGALRLDLRDQDLRAVVLAIVDEQRPAARSKGQSIEVRGAAGSARTDAARLFHTIHNLLSNALKYSAAGAKVTVNLSGTPARVRVEVDDEGPGLDDDDIERLFRPFERGPARPTASERSTGLGLYIARRMVELHGGTIGASSLPDLGARFWFELPR